MIVDKRALPDDPTPADAPPAYDDGAKYNALPEKLAHELPATESAVASSSRLQPSVPTSLGYTAPKSPIASSKKSPKGAKARWFPFGQAARAAQEVKQTVLNLLRDVVQVPELDAAISILRNCEEACESHLLSFSSIVQEQSVEGHSPLYWAIIKRPSDQVDSDGDLVQTLLSLASPLTEDTISEVRLACLQNSDQRLFQHLRRMRTLAPLSGADELLLGDRVPPDEVAVEDIPGDEGAFAVSFRFNMFQRRMRISKQISMEFIARGMYITRSSFDGKVNPRGRPYVAF